MTLISRTNDSLSGRCGEIEAPWIAGGGGTPVQQTLKIETSAAVPAPKLNMHFPGGQAVALLILPKRPSRHLKRCLYKQLHSIIHKLQNGKATQVSMDRWVVYTYVFHSALKRNQVLIHLTVWVIHEENQVKWARHERTHTANHLTCSA